jgi:hypothetical protein
MCRKNSAICLLTDIPQVDEKSNNKSKNPQTVGAIHELPYVD